MQVVCMFNILGEHCELFVSLLQQQQLKQCLTKLQLYSQTSAKCIKINRVVVDIRNFTSNTVVLFIQLNVTKTLFRSRVMGN